MSSIQIWDKNFLLLTNTSCSTSLPPFFQVIHSHHFPNRLSSGPNKSVFIAISQSVLASWKLYLRWFLTCIQNYQCVKITRRDLVNVSSYGMRQKYFILTTSLPYSLCKQGNLLLKDGSDLLTSSLILTAKSSTFVINLFLNLASVI